MTDLKISDFADGGAIQPTDEIAAVRGGVNTKVLAGSMAAEDAADYTPSSLLAAIATTGDGSDLVAGSVDTTQIADDAVTNAKIADNAVQTAQINNNAITSGKIAADAVTNAKLDNMAANTIKANITGGSANPTDPTLTALLDALIGTTRGSMIVRGASNWAAVTPGDAGDVWTSNGAGADLSWTPPSGGTLTSYTDSLAGNVALNNSANYFDGPSAAQGSSGTFIASGAVTCDDTVGVGTFIAKMWDGATVIASGYAQSAGANVPVTITLSGGPLVNPAGNIRISVRDSASGNGRILSNITGNSKDSTITVLQIA